MMDIMHMIDRDKIESSAPFGLARTFYIPNDAQRDTLLINGTTNTMIEVKPNG